jgi:chromosome segregation ATPase
MLDVLRALAWGEEPSVVEDLRMLAARARNERAALSALLTQVASRSAQFAATVTALAETTAHCEATMARLAAADQTHERFDRAARDIAETQASVAAVVAQSMTLAAGSQRLEDACRSSLAALAEVQSRLAGLEDRVEQMLSADVPHRRALADLVARKVARLDFVVLEAESLLDELRRRRPARQVRKPRPLAIGRSSKPATKTKKRSS